MAKRDIPDPYWKNIEAHFGLTVLQRMQQGYSEKPSASIKLNPNKYAGSLDSYLGKEIPWSAQGYLLTERPSFALDPHFHAGAYYVQDSSSMILELFLDFADLPKYCLALDLCAAPGGKSLSILEYIGPNGFLISNEIDGKRHDILQENLTKWGRINFATTKLDSSRFKREKNCFDLIVIDAPCSGEGMFRKDAFAVEQWNERLIESCSRTQESILEDAQSALAKDGYLVYSTCTTNPHENEHQIEKLLNSGEFELCLPDLSEFSEYLVEARLNSTLLGFYLLPGISTGEGLFISMLKKKSGAHTQVQSKKHRFQALSKVESKLNLPINAKFIENDGIYSAFYDSNDLLARFDSRFPFNSLGIPALELKGKKEIPLHGLAMYHKKYDTELNLEQALAYLRKESISAEIFETTGWQIVGYNDLPLGWVKVLANRANNYYPNKYRLRIKKQWQK